MRAIHAPTPQATRTPPRRCPAEGALRTTQGRYASHPPRRAAVGVPPYPAITGSNGSNTTVGQDVWNPISGWSQTLHATGPGNWQVTANMPLGNTAVVSFPNTGESYDSNLLTSFSSLYSSFSEAMNPTAGTSAEAGYDIWLNNWSNEVMIRARHGQPRRPVRPGAGHRSFGGHGGVPMQRWNLCQYGSEIIWQSPSTGNGDVYGEHSGSVDVLAMLEWLVNNGGYLPQASNLTAIGYGFEFAARAGSTRRSR